MNLQHAEARVAPLASKKLHTRCFTITKNVIGIQLVSRTVEQAVRHPGVVLGHAQVRKQYPISFSEWAWPDCGLNNPAYKLAHGLSNTAFKPQGAFYFG